MQITILSYKIL